MNIQDVNAIASPLIRKYDWHTAQIDNGVRLTVTDGLKQAHTDITTGEDIEDEITLLIAEVDKHNFTVKA